MAALGALSHRLEQFDGLHFSFVKVFYNSSGDTVQVPTGAQSGVASVEADDTAPSISISAGSTADTVTLTGGTEGIEVYVITRHGGSAAGIGAR